VSRSRSSSRRVRSRRPLRGVLLAGAGLALTTALTSCSLSGVVYNAPLPGGADVGAHPLTLSADFDDVLDLVPQSAVKVDDVAVGRVSKISLNPDGHSAHVTLVVNSDVTLPAGTTARLDQTSLLGEKYVALQAPTTAVAGRPLTTGAHIPLAKTSEAAQIEQVLGALSLVLNGGDIGEFKEISEELQAIGKDRPGQIRAFLGQMDRFVSTMADRKGAITDALDGLDRLGTQLHRNEAKISTALDDLSPGMKVLANQRPQLVKMLKALDRLSGITVKTLNASQRDIVKDLQLLGPVLKQLADAGSALPDSLQILLTYPFPDAVLGAIKGDYFNAFVTTNFRTLPANCAEEGCAWPQVGSGSADSSSPELDSGTPSAKVKLDSVSPPTLLPPTDTPLPGMPSSTIPVPTTSGPATSGSSTTGSSSGSESASGGSSGSHSSSPTPGGTSSAAPSGSSDTSDAGSETHGSSTGPDSDEASGPAEGE